MNNFEFCNPVKVVFGKGSIARLSALIPEGSKVLMVYGGGSIKKNGIYGQVTKALEGFEVTEFPGIEANPHYETCMKAVEVVKEKKIDFLLAVGGGSVIDATKFIAVSIGFEGDPWDILSKGGEIKNALPLGTVLTLAATGSEMNERSVISRVSTCEKLNFASPLVFPKFSVLDPEVTYSLPARQVANGVVDSFIHVVEQYLTYPVNAKVQDAFSEGLMRVIHEEGLKVLDNPNDYDIRANLMWAGTIAHNGTCGVGAVEDWASHFMEHEVSAVYDVTHGAGLAVIFPAWLTYMASHNVGKVAQYAHRVWDVPESDDKKAMALEGVARLKSFFHAIGMPVTFKELGIEHPDIDLLVKKLHENKGEYVGNYVRLDAQATREIYELANQ